MLAVKDEVSGLSEFDTLAGTPAEMRSQLSHSDAERVIVLTFAHQNERTVKAIAEMLRSLGPLIATLIQQRQQSTLENIIEALIPSVPVPEHMLAEARQAVLESGEWLTAAQIAEFAGFSKSNPSAQPNLWKKNGLIFAISHRGTDYFPAYGLDPKTRYRPRAALADILRVFDHSKDAWGLAYWFASVNSFLGGKRPQDVLAAAPQRVIAAAADEMAAVAHG